MTNSAIYGRRIVDPKTGKEYSMVLTVDAIALYQRLLPKALANVGKSAKLANGNVALILKEVTSV